MSRYTTITIKREVKEKLEKLKKNKSWDEFLMNLLNEYVKLKKIEATKKLENSFTKEELETLEDIVKREKLKWKFKEPEELF
ncbi:MAG: antitoxin VapB family protein [Candidatus Baldrarchaeota archaeon]